MKTLSIQLPELSELIAENEHQRKQINELHARGNELLEETRAQRRELDSLRKEFCELGCDGATMNEHIEKLRKELEDARHISNQLLKVVIKLTKRYTLKTFVKLMDEFHLESHIKMARKHKGQFGVF
jgi:predicted nuclease with TOPRIM domain